MRNFLIAIVIATTIVKSSAQTAPSTQSSVSSEFDKPFSFEGDTPGSAPQGWIAKPAGTILVDGNISHFGKQSVRIERTKTSPNSYSFFRKILPLGLSGQKVELRGYLRTENVTGFAGLWMREDADGDMVEFDNMQKSGPKATNDWAEYSITLPLHPGAQELLFGALLQGEGKAWFDDIQLFVDGKPASQAPKAENSMTPLSRDPRFDQGSGIALNDLTEVQVDNLVLLGKVWGFLKYYHPRVASGEYQWDYELFRIMPAILAASDRPTAQALLLRWTQSLGPVPPCASCANSHKEESDLYLAWSQGHPLTLGHDLTHRPRLALRPDLGWISDDTILGVGLARALQAIQQTRRVKQQFYVSLGSQAQNPYFDHERGYTKVKLPDSGFQILSLYRFWNIVEYWYPYRDIVGENWDGALREFLPRLALAKSSDGYQREMMALIAQIHDTHANLLGSLNVRPPVGECRIPINLRFIRQRAVITAVDPKADSLFKSIRIGDVLTDLDGQSIKKLVQTWAPYYGDSNEAARLRDISQAMTNGPCGPVSVGLLRKSEVLSIKLKRLSAAEMSPMAETHDLPGETFRLLSDQVAYLKLSTIRLADVSQYVELAAKTKGLIIDIRNYPSEFVLFDLGSHLVEESIPFAKFTIGDLSNPGSFYWTDSVTISPALPHYRGKVVILVDEITQSQAEYTTMALRASPNAIVIGSTTAGADGNVSTIPIPGGFSAWISGIGVFYPDGKPTQQIGIVPDKTVAPTIEGIRAHRDEVLEEAVRQILGSGTSIDIIQRLLKGAPE